MEIPRPPSESIKRFSTYRLIEHWLNALLFTALVITGLAQKFYSLDLSQWIIMYLGGIDMSRLIHRISGLLLVLLTVQHVFVAFFGVVYRKWKPSMLITKRDFTDAVTNLKYYFGLRKEPAFCDRYDYKQKFDYWCVLTGQLIMIVTGLSLWFPTFVTSILPGEIVPAAKALHSNHALLILLIIALWHIYNAIFSPEVFPLDISIFTGYIPRVRMLREHPLELARIEGSDVEEIVRHFHGEAAPLKAEKSLP